MSTTTTKTLTTEALAYHKNPTPGKIGTKLTKPMASTDDLALAYSPGVAEPVKAIANNQQLVYEYTGKGNLVAVISNGTAILGLGNKGPFAAKPVMEGKAALFKKFANLDSFDIELDATDPDEIVKIIAAISPTFGGINLEDIKAPECFYIEEKLQELLDIPVFHDDQHGTAITVAAALTNALSIQNKAIKDIKIIVQGAGASALACGQLFLDLGINLGQIIFSDSKGILTTSRKDLNKYKQKFATNKSYQDIYEAANGADVFIDLAGATISNPEKLIKAMNNQPILFTLSNPTPCIPRDLILSLCEDAIIATGLSNLPNQVNNVVCFPYIFRGALDAKAKQITTNMKIAAMKAIAKIAQQDNDLKLIEQGIIPANGLSRDYILPKPNDPRLLLEVPKAVQAAAN